MGTAREMCVRSVNLTTRQSGELLELLRCTTNYLMVGQNDCRFLQCPDMTMMIFDHLADAGVRHYR